MFYFIYDALKRNFASMLFENVPVNGTSSVLYIIYVNQIL